MKLRAVENDLYTSGRLKMAGALADNTIVGIVELYNYDPINKHAAVGVIVDSAHRRKGHGEAMVNAMVDFCRDNLSVHHLYCDIIDTNTVSRHLFERCGFRESGHFADWVIVDDQYHATTRMSLIVE